MKIFLLFYMCHFAMGLTHCYKTTVFYIYNYNATKAGSFTGHVLKGMCGLIWHDLDHLGHARLIHTDLSRSMRSSRDQPDSNALLRRKNSLSLKGATPYCKQQRHHLRCRIRQWLKLCTYRGIYIYPFTEWNSYEQNFETNDMFTARNGRIVEQNDLWNKLGVSCSDRETGY